MFDQMVRNHSGGEMLEYWKQNPMPAESFVIERAGSEVLNLLPGLRQSAPPDSRPSREDRLGGDPQMGAGKIGEFRSSGEIHLWMYDRYSLGRLLQESGFKNVKICRANESDIPNFNGYLLDIEANGAVRKPDSLFMEARKP